MPAWDMVRRGNPFRHRQSVQATTESDAQGKDTLQFNEELALYKVQIAEFAAKCGHREVHPFHIAFLLLYRAKDIPQASKPLRSIPARPILDIPLLWRMLVAIGRDPNGLGESLRSELLKLNMPSDQNSTYLSTPQIPASILDTASNYALNKGDKFLSIHHVLLAILDQHSVQVLIGGPEVLVQLIDVLERFHSERILVFSTRPQYFYLNNFADDLTEVATSDGVDPAICRDEEVRRLLCIMSRRSKCNVLLLGNPGVGKTAIVEGLARNIVSRTVPLALNGRVFSLDLARLLAGTSCKGVYERRVEALLAEIERNEGAGRRIFLFINSFHLIVTGKRIGGEGGIDAADLFKPVLARGKIHCIGATTPEEYQRCILLDSSLERRFSIIYVEEPSTRQATTMLRGVRELYQDHHRVYISDKALTTAVNLAKRYNTKRKLPDSAIDIVDEACSRLYVANETCPFDVLLRQNEIRKLKIYADFLKKEGNPQNQSKIQALEGEAENIRQELVREHLARSSQYTETKRLQDEKQNIRDSIHELRSSQKFAEARKRESDLDKESHRHERLKSELDQVNRIGRAEVQAVLPTFLWAAGHSDNEHKLRHLEEILLSKVVGQRKALAALIRPIHLTSTGLEHPTLPLGSLLLVGPSGCGKTLAVRTLAHSLFDSYDRLITIDGNSYCDNLSVTRLIGTPITCADSFNMAGELTDFVKRTPGAIILVNQADKLCPEIKSMFAQILDCGQLNDGNGDAINFRNSFIFFTSTLPQSKSLNEAEEHGFCAHNDLLKDVFGPQFVNRLDGVVHFRKLSPLDLRGVFDLRLEELDTLLNKRGIKLSISPENREKLWRNIQKPGMLARDVNHSIQTVLVSSISDTLLHDQPYSPGTKTTMNVHLGSGEHVTIAQTLFEDLGDGRD